MLKLLGKLLNNFNYFLYDIPLDKQWAKYHNYHKSLFFIYWDKKCQILELEFFGKVTYLFVG